jgi:hypothetical protein
VEVDVVDEDRHVLNEETVGDMARAADVGMVGDWLLRWLRAEAELARIEEWLPLLLVDGGRWSLWPLWPLKDAGESEGDTVLEESADTKLASLVLVLLLDPRKLAELPMRSSFLQPDEPERWGGVGRLSSFEVDAVIEDDEAAECTAFSTGYIAGNSCRTSCTFVLSDDVTKVSEYELWPLCCSFCRVEASRWLSRWASSGGVGAALEEETWMELLAGKYAEGELVLTTSFFVLFTTSSLSAEAGEFAVVAAFEKARRSPPSLALEYAVEAEDSEVLLPDELDAAEVEVDDTILLPILCRARLLLPPLLSSSLSSRTTSSGSGSSWMAIFNTVITAWISLVTCQVFCFMKYGCFGMKWMNEWN